MDIEVDESKHVVYAWNRRGKPEMGTKPRNGPWGDVDNAERLDWIAAVSKEAQEGDLMTVTYRGDHNGEKQYIRNVDEIVELTHRNEEVDIEISDGSRYHMYAWNRRTTPDINSTPRKGPWGGITGEKNLDFVAVVRK